VQQSLNVTTPTNSEEARTLGKLKTTNVSRVIRIPLSVWNRYRLTEKDFEADWYDSMDRDIDREVDAENAVVIHFRRKQD
jgi:hypothetical protein